MGYDPSRISSIDKEKPLQKQARLGEPMVIRVRKANPVPPPIFYRARGHVATSACVVLLQRPDYSLLLAADFDSFSCATIESICADVSASEDCQPGNSSSPRWCG
jgi:hypothetical protein